MKVLIFGSYDLHQNTNSDKIDGMRDADIEIIHCREEFWPLKRNKPEFFSAFSMLKFALKFPFYCTKLMIKYAKAGKHDVILVLYPGNPDIFLAKILATINGEKIVYSPFISAYQGLVFQRNYFNKESMKARLLFLLDKLPCMLADVIILDTNAHADYFSSTFQIDRKKFRRVFGGRGKLVPVGQGRKNKKFTVLFYGSLIRGHGIEKIIDAAELLKDEDLVFRFIGDGPMGKTAIELVQEKKLKNVSLDIRWF